MHWRSCFKGFKVTLALASLLLMACSEGRFPICHSNEECKGPDGGPSGKICYNLRCVECRYDTDCPAGKVCNSLSTCDALNAAPTPEPVEKPDGSAVAVPVNWDECAKDCKDQACLNQCDAKFHPPK